MFIFLKGAGGKGGRGYHLFMGVRRGGQEGALDPPGQPKYYVF